MRESRLGIERRVLIINAALLILAFPAASCAPTLGQTSISALDVQSEAEKQREMAFDVFIRRQEKLDSVAWPLSEASAALCPKTRYAYGLMLHDLDSYSTDYRAAAAKKFNLGPGTTTVRSVIKGFPADLAGVRAGDTIVAVHRTPINGKTFQQVIELMKVRDASADSLRMTIRRDGVEETVVLMGRKICDYPASVIADDAVNAYADGSRVAITSGMVRFAETDDELALVVGHEMAHNARGHLDKKRGNAVLGGIFDVAIALGTGVNTGGAFSSAAGEMFSQEFETEADYVGVYFAARGGFDVGNAPSFWRRMAVEHPGSIKKNFMASHPSTPERFLRLERAVEEIVERREKGEPLVPVGGGKTDSLQTKEDLDYVGSGRMSKRRR